jgi:hypothetical protein
VGGRSYRAASLCTVRVMRHHLGNHRHTPPAFHRESAVPFCRPASLPPPIHFIQAAKHRTGVRGGSPRKTMNVRSTRRLRGPSAMETARSRRHSMALALRPQAPGSTPFRLRAPLKPRRHRRHDLRPTGPGPADRFLTGFRRVALHLVAYGPRLLSGFHGLLSPTPQTAAAFAIRRALSTVPRTGRAIRLAALAATVVPGYSFL